MWTNIRYILITAVRDRLFFGLILGVIAAGFIASAMGYTALLEPEQMTLTFSASAARMILAIGLIVFACFHVRHAFDSKEIDVLLSRPISRHKVVLSYWLGFALISMILVAPVAIILYVLGVLNMQGYIIWCLSLLCEVWLVVAIALFASFTLSSAVSSVLASLGFYVLSRMMGFFIATAENATVFSNIKLNMTFEYAISVVSIFIPRLDFFSKSHWLVYGVADQQTIILFVAQAVIFTALLIAATMLDFRRKQF